MSAVDEASSEAANASTGDIITSSKAIPKAIILF
jgi:hypothetical protein